MNPEEIRFAGDAMLLLLAKWLRLLGYDCVAESGLFGRELLEKAVAERRWALTRNRRFGAEMPLVLLARADIYPVSSQGLPGEVREVVERFSLDHTSYRFTRCLVCNEPLARVTKADAGQGAPAEVLEREEWFWKCNRCGRIYWQGSHVHRSIERLDRWLESKDDKPGRG